MESSPTLSGIEDEREATRALIGVALRMIEQGVPGTPAADVNAWLSADDARPFPRRVPRR